MRTDRELLELAAKAAGIQVLKWSANHAGGEIGRGLARNEEWNPLNDDGDALRLAHQLGLRIHWFGPLTEVRRAIVRAAAEIGAAM